MYLYIGTLQHIVMYLKRCVYTYIIHLKHVYAFLHWRTRTHIYIYIYMPIVYLHLYLILYVCQDDMSALDWMNSEQGRHCSGRYAFSLEWRELDCDCYPQEAELLRLRSCIYRYIHVHMVLYSFRSLWVCFVLFLFTVSIYLSIDLSISLSVCLFVCLSVCLFV